MRVYLFIVCVLIYEVQCYLHVPMLPRTAALLSECTTSLYMGARNKAWAKGELSDKDIFDPDDNSLSQPRKQKTKLEPEEIIYEGPPSRLELLIPAISILTVIGIIPFVAALTRQFWVKYKITSRRISVKSGIDGRDFSEVTYPEIQEVRFAYRALGAAGDMVLFLKGGAKVEMRFVPDFPRLYDYIISRCDEPCRMKSQKRI